MMRGMGMNARGSHSIQPFAVVERRGVVMHGVHGLRGCSSRVSGCSRVTGTWESVLILFRPLQGFPSLFATVPQGDALRRCRGALPRADLFGPFGPFVIANSGRPAPNR